MTDETNDRHERVPREDEEEGIVDEAIAYVAASSRKRRIEMFTATLMAIAVIGVAWVSYESSRWGNVQKANINQGNASRTDSIKASSAAGQLGQIDIALFTEAINAFARNDMDLFQFYVDRARPEFEPALAAWLATDPANNPDAPPSPFELPEYASARAAQAAELNEAAAVNTQLALQAKQRSDNFVLAAVVFAAVLFFAGISSRFHAWHVRFAMLSVATAGFLINSVWVATFPVVLRI